LFGAANDLGALFGAPNSLDAASFGAANDAPVDGANTREMRGTVLGTLLARAFGVLLETARGTSMLKRLTFGITVAALAALAGCIAEDPNPSSGPKGAEQVCVDGDGDGFGVGCSAGEDCDDSDPLVFDECPGPDDPPVGDCADGTTRDCKVTLPEQNGVKNCFTGIQKCESGAWGECSKKQKK